MTNLASTLRRRARSAPLSAHDRLPAPARHWAAHAALPWSAASVARMWDKAMRETRDEQAALARLSAAESRMLARDSRKVWGADYPLA